MASLVINSMTFDQSVYNPGSTITLTVNYTSDDFTAAAVSSTATATAADSDVSVNQSAAFSVANGPDTMLPVTVTVTDNRATPGTWTLVSDTVSGSGPWTGVAVLTSVA
jgi:hypothetical protein